MSIDLEMNLKKATTRLLRHPETRYLSGIVVSGRVEIRDDIPTACTDGWNSYYGREWCGNLSLPQLTGVKLHEDLHKSQRHCVHFQKLWKKDARLANAAMDYQVNSIIHNLKDKTLAVLPEPHLYDPKFHNWSVQQIFEFLSTGNNPDGGNEGKPEQGEDGDSVKIGKRTYGLGAMDEHLQPQDGEGQPGQPGQPQPGQPQPGQPQGLSQEDAKDLASKVNEALQKGAIIAGAMGLDLPRGIQDALAPEIRWQDELADFLTSSVRGAEELTFRRYNRKYLADDMYMPTMHDEAVNEIIVAIDTSGSIGNAELSVFAGHLSALCASTNPDKVRVLWWDTTVHGEQVFLRGTYDNLRDLLKPQGGGGTRVSSVSEYIVENKYTPECVVVFTDGYVEHDIDWHVSVPTLWLVTESNSFVPPAGRKVIFNK